MKKLLRFALTVKFFLAVPLLAHAGAVEDLRAYLEGTQSLKARFEQSVSTRAGQPPRLSSGTLALQRPGKLRWEIQAPFPQLVVSDGQRIWIHDPDLQQVTVRKADAALGGSPAALLTGQGALERNFVLSELGEAEGLAWVQALPKNPESGFERVRIGLSGREMRVMELQDNFGQTTRIRLLQVERNPALPPATFRFKAPPGTEVVGE